MKNLAVVILILTVFDILTWNILFRAIRKGAETELYFLNVGQGDSSLIVLPGSVQILVDGGPPNGQLLSELHDVLGREDHYIDLLIMTHPQLDHFGGFIALLDSVNVGAFITNGRAGDTGSYAVLRNKLAAKRIPYITLREGDYLRYGASKMKFLAPSPLELMNEELNDTCLVFQLFADGMSALYTGDIGSAVEKRLASKNIKSSILKVSHHGSRFSSTAEFLRSVDPLIATIGVGKNRYGHPTPAAIGRLEDVGAKVFRTDRNGTIRISRKNLEMEVFTKTQFKQ
ncbi:MAG: MBL fold metallo-hydrolase [Patescibacteria group bacterium]